MYCYMHTYVLCLFHTEDNGPIMPLKHTQRMYEMLIFEDRSRIRVAEGSRRSSSAVDLVLVYCVVL